MLNPESSLSGRWYSAESLSIPLMSTSHAGSFPHPGESGSLPDNVCVCSQTFKCYRVKKVSESARVREYVCVWARGRKSERERKKKKLCCHHCLMQRSRLFTAAAAALTQREEKNLVNPNYFFQKNFFLTSRLSFNRILNNYMGLICNFTIKMWLSSLINQWKRALLQLSLWLVIAWLHYHNKYPYETN